MISPAGEEILKQKGAYLSYLLTYLKDEYPASIQLRVGYKHTLLYFKNKQQNWNPIKNIRGMANIFTLFRKERLLYVWAILKYLNPTSEHMLPKRNWGCLTYSLSEFSDVQSISSKEEEEGDVKTSTILTVTEFNTWRAKESEDWEKVMNGFEGQNKDYGESSNFNL